MFPGRALLTYDDYNFRFCNGRASSRSLLWSVVVSASSCSLVQPARTRKKVSLAWYTTISDDDTDAVDTIS